MPISQEERTLLLEERFFRDPAGTPFTISEGIVISEALAEECNTSRVEIFLHSFFCIDQPCLALLETIHDFDYQLFSLNGEVSFEELLEQETEDRPERRYLEE